MEQLFDIFFNLSRCAIRGVEADRGRLETLSESDWASLAEMAAKTGTTSLLYPVLAKYEGQHDKNNEALAGWKNQARYSVLRQMEMHRAAYAICAESERRGLSPVFFKGVILADLYPHYSQRRSIDIDILVSEGEKEDTIQMLEAMGYVQNHARSIKHVQVLSSTNPVSTIELHTRLWEDYEGKKIGILESLDLASQEGLVRVRACGLDVLTLEPGRHLAYQMFHIVKHFMLDGVGMRYLIDITLFIEKYKEQIDFNVFWNNMEALSYERFAKQFINLCKFCMGLDTNGINLGDSVLDNDTISLLADIMHGATIGKDIYRWQILGVMTPYFVGEKKISKTSFIRKFDAIFLRREDLTAPFEYAKKHRVLLPVAWVHRGVGYALRYFRYRKNFYGASAKLNIIENRLDLMNRMGLVDEK